MAESVLATQNYEGQGIRALYPKELVSTLYAEDNNNPAALESSISGNDVIMSFPQNSFGSSNTFKFDSSSTFISQMFVQFVIKVTGTANDLLAFATDYPAYNLIQDIRYQVGGTQQQIIYGEQLVDYLHEIVANDDKKKRLMELCGRRKLLCSNGVSKYYALYAFLPLPWSNPNAHNIMNNNKPFPISRVKGGIDVIIRTRPSLVYSAVTDATKVTVTLDSSNLFFKYHKVSNPQMEKKVKIAYPFQSPLYYSQKSVTLAQNSAATLQSIVSLDGFPDGNLTNILLHANASGSQRTSGVAGSLMNDIYAGIPIGNVTLLLGGKVIWQCNSLQDPMWDCLSGNKKSIMTKRRFTTTGVSNLVDDYYGNVLKVGATNEIEFDGYDTGARNDNISTTSGESGRNFYYVIPIAETRLCEMKQLGEYCLGGDFGKETLSLRIGFPNVDTTGGAVTVNIFITYVYSGIYYINEDRQVTLTIG